MIRYGRTAGWDAAHMSLFGHPAHAYERAVSKGGVGEQVIEVPR
jgi:hypothetical protein